MNRLHHQFFGLLLLVFLLPLIACSAQEEERTAEGREALPDGETYTSLFSEAMIELSQRMVEITGRVETVADADAVEEDVAGALDTLAIRMAYIVDNLDRLIEADPEGFRDPADIMESPDVRAARLPAEEAMHNLREMNPTAAIRLQLHAEGHSERAARLIDQITLRWETRSGEHLGD